MHNLAAWRPHGISSQDVDGPPDILPVPESIL